VALGPRPSGSPSPRVRPLRPISADSLVPEHRARAQPHASAHNGDGSWQIRGRHPSQVEPPREPGGRAQSPTALSLAQAHSPLPPPTPRPPAVAASSAAPSSIPHPAQSSNNQLKYCISRERWSWPFSSCRPSGMSASRSRAPRACLVDRQAPSGEEVSTPLTSVENPQVANF